MTSFALTSLALVSFITVISTLLYIITAIRNPLNKVPGPWYARWTNLPLKLAVIGGRRIHHVHALHKKYGPYVRIAPAEVAVNSLIGFKQIHGINSGFVKSQWYQVMAANERPGVFNMIDPKQHAMRRKLFARPFSKTHLREHWEPALREKVVLAVSRMRADARSSSAGVVDVMKWWTFMASDISSHLMFGDSFRTLEKGEVSQYMRVLASILMAGGIGSELPLVRTIGRHLPLRAAQELFAGNEIINGYGRAAVANMKASDGGKNIFANMMASQAEAEKGESLEDKDVELEASNLIVAGTDTTAVTLTYLVFAMLSQPSLQRELEAELAGLPEAYADADLEQLPLLSAVVEETLRLYGAAPGMLPRTVPAGGVDIGGFFLPRGTTATTQSYSLHRDPYLFPDPNKFIPSRWLSAAQDREHQVSNAARAAFSPFGAGSRTCLGIHLAYMELRLAAAEFFRECGNSRLAASASPACMEQENYFLIAPAGHKCEVVLV